MKITIITTPFLGLPPDAIGAVEKLYYLLAGEWAKKGHCVTFICAGGGDDERMSYLRLKRFSRTGSIKKDLFWDLAYSIKALFVCPRTDILLCNTFWSPALAPIFRWKYKRLVYGVHRFPKKQFFLYRFVHQFVCVSSVVAAELRKQIASEKVFVVNNPIDTTIFNSAQRSIVKGRVLYSGRIHPRKGLIRLAQACSLLAKEGLVKELFLVGTSDFKNGGGGEPFVEEIKKNCGDCPVVFTGAIKDPGELAAVIRTAEVYAYPSEDPGETFGVAPLEAMGLGVPVALSNLECFKDYAVDGKNSLMAEPLVDELRTLITNGGYAAKIAEAGSHTAAKFTAEDIAMRYIKVFEDVV